MRILIVPNTFRDCLSAHQVAEAMAEGLSRAVPTADLKRIPLSDGGDGLLETAAAVPGLERQTVQAQDPLERWVDAHFLLDRDRHFAIIEMAEISGLRRLALSERNPIRTTTRGSGQLIRAALDAGARHIVVGIGGSATMDCGAGALVALGFRFLDAEGRELHPSPRALVALASVDRSQCDPRLALAELVLFNDVSTPLKASLGTFGGQKGARSEDQDTYQSSYAAMTKAFSAAGYDVWETPFLGAGGGLAAGLHVFAGAKPRAGAQGVAELLGLEQEIAQSDLIVTGEGRLDPSSLAGKLPFYVANLAQRYAKPCLILTGQLEDDVCQHLPEGCAAFGILRKPLELAASIEAAAPLIAGQCEQLLRLYRFAKAAH